jgi:hypothetical protein
VAEQRVIAPGYSVSHQVMSESTVIAQPGQPNIKCIPGRSPAGRAAPGLGVIAAAGCGLRDPGQGLSDASVDPTEARNDVTIQLDESDTTQ